MRVEGQNTTRPHQSPTDNLPRPVQGRSNDRNVESLPTLESLLYKIVEFFDDVATELKPIGSYLCQVLTLKNFMRAASELRHETEQATIDVTLKNFMRAASELRHETEQATIDVTLKNFMRAASELRHETEQATIDVKLKYADSRSERFRLQARKEMNEFKHDLKNGWADFKDDVKSGWNKLVK